MLDAVDKAKTHAVRGQETWHAWWHDRDLTLLEDFPAPAQFDGWSCGAQCVYAVLWWYGKRPSFYKLARRLGSTEGEGTDQRSMRRVLNRLGFTTSTIYSLSKIRSAIDNDAPVIALVDDEQHWVVVYGYDDDGGYWCADPSDTAARVGRKTFKRWWDGFGIAVQRR